MREEGRRGGVGTGVEGSGCTFMTISRYNECACALLISSCVILSGCRLYGW